MSKSSGDGNSLSKRASIFGRNSLNTILPNRDRDDNSPTPELSLVSNLLKKRRTPSLFSSGASSPGGYTESHWDDSETPTSPFSPARQETFPRSSGLSSSGFGSWKSVRSDDIEEPLTAVSVTPPSINWGEIDIGTRGRNVLHHGEIQIGNAMFKKKKEYLVLTDTHLIRFKNKEKAALAFSVIGPVVRRNSSFRQSSIASVGSFTDLQKVQSDATSEERATGILLKQVVAVNTLDDGRPYFAIEVASLNEDTNNAPILTIQIANPKDRDVWLARIRSATERVRAMEPAQLSVWNTHQAARNVKYQHDYDLNEVSYYKVVKRNARILGDHSSSDDLAKIESSVCILAIGVHKVHIMSLVKFPHRGSSLASTPRSKVSSNGIMAMTALRLGEEGHTLELTFRIPLRNPKTYYISSMDARSIALNLRLKEEYLRPEWSSRPYTFKVPEEINEHVEAIQTARPIDGDCFPRTLTAYCVAYGVDPSNISYRITEPPNDPPCFDLLTPYHPKRKYEIVELLAVMRALRYNESFHTISFANVSLDQLNGLHDDFGFDHLCSETKKGVAMEIPVEEQKAASVLVQELRALAVTSKRLWHMDFTSCITRNPRNVSDGNKSRDTGCGILEALCPLCKAQTTNVDWIVLNNIRLGETDLDFLIDAAVERKCHLRAIEISNCGLQEQQVDLILDSLEVQNTTLEAIDISRNPARINPLRLAAQLRPFDLLRKLNLSYLSRTSGPEPFLSTETLLNWRLQELSFSSVMLNKESIEAISCYLASPQSNILRILRLDKTNLSGKDISVLMHSMTKTAGEGRKLHVDISENYLEAGHRHFVQAIAEGYAPSMLTLKLLEYQKEHYFQQLIVALTGNTTIKYLDISKASLPSDASDETSEAMERMFALNTTLEELNLSGEDSRLEVSKIGDGINRALSGLKYNKTLRVLHIERQRLGIQGARTLADILKVNRTLEELHCDYNGITLSGFTDMINALQQNTTMLYLPYMNESRNNQINQTRASVEGAKEDDTKSTMTMKSASVRNIAKRVTGKSRDEPSKSELTEQDINAALRMVDDAWGKQVDRLAKILQRNYNLAHGIQEPVDTERPDTSSPEMGGDIEKIMEKARIDRTPTMEQEIYFQHGGDGTSDDPSPREWSSEDGHSDAEVVAPFSGADLDMAFGQAI
ncbi:RNI-like protein [Patellaria atrata CBS 101060]|uniref:RNI-like protein n=1 Tax=Patellaria atrata CBS 101060 TaxID=1346257 RepID=A0A9P4VVC4_9PEZI|nr:RNI-like protein [Patellaria atrata CBS 101060]